MRPLTDEPALDPVGERQAGRYGLPVRPGCRAYLRLPAKRGTRPVAPLRRGAPGRRRKRVGWLSAI